MSVSVSVSQAAQTASNAASNADSGLGLSVQERKAMEAAERGVENPLYSDSGPLQCVAVTRLIATF